MKMDYNNMDVEELIIIYREEKDDMILQCIIDKCEGIIISLAKKYQISIPGAELEDLISEAHIVLWDVVKEYNINAKCKFTSFLYSCLRQNYNTLYRFATSQKRYSPEPIFSFDDCFDSSYYDDYTNIVVKEFINSLDEKYLYIVRCLVNDVKKSDIAKKLNITPASLSYHIGRLKTAYIAAISGSEVA